MTTAGIIHGVYEIDLTRMAPYEAVAMVLTLLAYPDDGPPTPSLDQRFAETCAFVLRSRAEADPDWAEELQHMRPAHALLHPDRAAAAGKTLATQLEKRLTAGLMAIPFLNLEAPLPNGVKRLSQTEMAQFVAPDRDAKNVGKRDFRPSRPVLHLCVALACLNLLAVQRGLRAGPVDVIIRDRETLRRFLDVARDMEEPVLAAKGLGVTGLNRIRWIDN